MRALIVNCSPGHYNLAVAKMADWLRAEGHDVDVSRGDPGMFALGYDVVALSVTFSWHALVAREIALRVKANSDVWAGGPGLFALQHWWKTETGLQAQRGLDWRFERQRGDYLMCFASRGCPVGCSFCSVPGIEGLEFTLDPEFRPAPILCDNNLSALPPDFQVHIIERYQLEGRLLLDANSGFEPRTFDEATFARWEPLLASTGTGKKHAAPWRFAFDEQAERDDVLRVLDVLHAVPARRKRVYCLVGNEPVESCYDRAETIIAHGGEPHCQFVMQLNYLGGAKKCRYDWTQERATDFARYYNTWGYRSYRLWEYNHRKGEQSPFAFLKPAATVSS